MTYMVFFAILNFLGRIIIATSALDGTLFLQVWDIVFLCGKITKFLEKNSFIHSFIHADATYNRSSLRILLHCFQSKHAFLSKI